MATSLPESQYFAVLFDDKYYVGKYLSYDGDILLLMLMELFDFSPESARPYDNSKEINEQVMKLLDH